MLPVTASHLDLANLYYSMSTGPGRKASLNPSALSNMRFAIKVYEVHPTYFTTLGKWNHSSSNGSTGQTMGVVVLVLSQGDIQS